MDGLNQERTGPPEKISPLAILLPSLKVGALSGTSGLFIGGIVGILRSSRPGIFATASGLQWFALGSTFWATRSLFLSPAFPHTLTSRTATPVSAALAFTTTSLLVTRAPSASLFYGTFLFALVGFLGQSAYTHLDARNTRYAIAVANGEIGEKKGLWTRVAEMKWSPMKVLTDEEYARMLRERMVRVEAEIAVVDEDLEGLRGKVERKRMEGEGAKKSG